MSERISKRCKHRNTVRRVWSDIVASVCRGNGWIDATESAPGPFDAIVCNDCHEWLPLGHSDESPERVAQEIRAAKLAADMTEGVGIGGHHPDHCDGEHCWHWSADEDDGPCCYCDEDYRHEDYGLYMECHVGHLARVIATHKETPCLSG